MRARILALGLLATLLAASSIHAQTPAAGSPKPAASAVDPATIQALKDMGAYLQTLKRFRVSTDVTGERVLADGQKLQHSARANLEVARPAKLRARMSSARSERELIYDGKTVTLYAPAQKYYSTVEFTDSIGALIERLEERYGVELPLADLFRWGTPAAPLDKIESAMNAGQDFIGKDLCDPYAVILASFAMAPEPAFDDSRFRFTPPKGASMVATVPPNCVPVNYGGMIYQQCGGTWYMPQGSQYVVVNPPY